MKKSDLSLLTGLAAAIFIAAASGCTSDNYHVPQQAAPPLHVEPAIIETGSRIPRGKDQPVRDSTQNVDVYTEEELEADRPVNTRDAVRRAVIGR